MISVSSSLKFQNASVSMRQSWSFLVWKIVLPLTVLALLFLLDYPLRAFVQDQQSPFLNHCFGIIKYGGDAIVGLCLALALIGFGKFISNDRLLRAGKLMLFSLIAANSVVFIAKPVLNIHPRNDFVSVERQDPDAMRWGRFPSGDATVAFCVVVSLVGEFPPLLIPLYTIGFLVGVERVYFNLHFFSDVFAGAWLAIVVVNVLRHKYFFGLPADSSRIATRDIHP